MAGGERVDIANLLGYGKPVLFRLRKIEVHHVTLRLLGGWFDGASRNKQVIDIVADIHERDHALVGKAHRALQLEHGTFYLHGGIAGIGQISFDL